MSAPCHVLRLFRIPDLPARRDRGLLLAAARPLLMQVARGVPLLQRPPRARHRDSPRRAGAAPSAVPSVDALIPPPAALLPCSQNPASLRRARPPHPGALRVAATDGAAAGLAEAMHRGGGLRPALRLGAPADAPLPRPAPRDSLRGAGRGHHAACPASSAH